MTRLQAILAIACIGATTAISSPAEASITRGLSRPAFSIKASTDPDPFAAAPQLVLPSLTQEVRAIEERQAAAAECVALCDLAASVEAHPLGVASAELPNRSEDAWGNYRFTSELETSHNRFGFTGHYWDKEASLYYAKARYYDPFTARFTQADSFLGTIDDPPSLHRYQYANDNPTMYVDPTGYASEEDQKPQALHGGRGATIGADSSASAGRGAIYYGVETVLEFGAPFSLGLSDPDTSIHPLMPNSQSSTWLSGANQMSSDYAAFKVKYGRQAQAAEGAAVMKYGGKVGKFMGTAMILMSVLSRSKPGEINGTQGEQGSFGPDKGDRAALPSQVHASAPPGESPGFIVGSGGPGKVYKIPGQALTARKDYFGSTDREIPERMSDKGHRAKTPAGIPPPARTLARNLTPQEKMGLEALLAHEQGMENLSNKQTPIDPTLPKNASRVEAAVKLLEQVRDAPAIKRIFENIEAWAKNRKR